MLSLPLKILYDYLMESGDTSGYIVLYLKTARSHIVAIKSILAQQKPADMEELFRHAHSLKGSSDVMGQDSISKICGQIITLIRPRQTIQEANGQIISDIQELTKELDQNLQILETKQIGESTTT